MAMNGEQPESFGSFSFLQGEETVEIPIIEAAPLLAEMEEKDTAGAEVDTENIPDPDPAPAATLPGAA